MDNRLVAVCCRSQYIDILQVTGNRLSVTSKNTAVDVCGSGNIIRSIGQHASHKNTVMLGGSEWIKRLDLKLK